MKKNRAGIFFFLATYFLLLAFSVLPHHHHNEIQICLAEVHCHADDDSHHKKHDQDSHSHDKNGADHCIFDQDIILPANQKKIECKCIDCKGIHVSITEIISEKFNTDLNLRQPPDLHNHEVLYMYSAKKTLLSSPMGFRAPPIV